MMWYAWYVSVILCAWLRIYIYIYFYTPMYILRMLILYCIVDTPVKGGKKCGVDPDRQAASRYHRWLCRPKTSIPKSPILTFPKNWVHDWVYHSKPYITQFPDLWSPKLGQSTYTSLDFRRRSMILPCVPNIFGDKILLLWRIQWHVTSGSCLPVPQLEHHQCLPRWSLVQVSSLKQC